MKRWSCLLARFMFLSHKMFVIVEREPCFRGHTVCLAICTVYIYEIFLYLYMYVFPVVPTSFQQHLGFVDEQFGFHFDA